MHAGVLEELRARAVPITHLSAVSGGAIVAAFYSVGGDPKAFRDAVGAGRLNLGRALVNLRNVLRLPFPFQMPFTELRLFPWYAFGRADVQAQLLDRVLFRGRTLSSLPASPLLQICATDLRTGKAVGITAGETILVDAPVSSASALKIEYTRDVPELYPTGAGSERIATLVAASGAFPGFFNAVPVSWSGEAEEERRYSTRLRALWTWCTRAPGGGACCHGTFRPPCSYGRWT
jgi:predicted acylesterase/phospholipase RssA